MDTIAAILQPFCLIALGFVLVHLPLFPRTLWDGVEKLVYYVLFPPLLFTSVAKADFVLSETGIFLAGALLECGRFNQRRFFGRRHGRNGVYDE